MSDRGCWINQSVAVKSFRQQAQDPHVKLSVGSVRVGVIWGGPHHPCIRLVSIHIGHIPGAVGDAGYLYIRVVYLLKSLCLLLWPLLWKWGRQMVD